jgi:hypothetical protein
MTKPSERCDPFQGLVRLACSPRAFTTSQPEGTFTKELPVATAIPVRVWPNRVAYA